MWDLLSIVSPLPPIYSLIFFFFFTSVLWEHKRFHSNDFFSLNIKFFFLSFVDDEDTQYKWVNMEIMMMDTTRRERERREEVGHFLFEILLFLFLYDEKKKSEDFFIYSEYLCNGQDGFCGMTINTQEVYFLGSLNCCWN